DPGATAAPQVALGESRPLDEPRGRHLDAPSAGNEGIPFHRFSRSAKASTDSTGFVKNEPTERVLGSAGSSTIDLLRRSASTASRTTRTASPGATVSSPPRPATARSSSG